MNKVRLAFLAIFTSFLIVFSVPSNAMLAGELLEEKDSNVIYNYLAGLADMMSYMEYVNGNEAREKCIYDWFYNTEGSIEKIHYYLEKYSDRFSEGILIILAKRACPLPESKN